MVITPLIIVWPELATEGNRRMWVCDGFWVLNMLFSAITIKLGQNDLDPLEVFVKYIKGMFILDAISTFGPITSF